MFRHPTLALGLLAFSLLAVAPGRPATGQEPAAGHATPAEVNATASRPTASDAAATPGETTAHRAAVEEEKKEIMEGEPSLAIYTVIVFGLVLLILSRFAWKPMIRALHEREAHLQQVLTDSERARNEAEALAADHRRQMARAADEVRDLIDKARKEGQVAADSIVRKAQAEAEAARDRAEREISGARDQALMEIWSKTADLAVSVAGKVLDRELGESDHRRLIETAMNELPADAAAAGGRS